MGGRNNRSGGCNKEIGRQQGREDKRGHWGRTQNQLKTIEEHEGGRAMGDGEYRPLSEGAREEENPTHAT
jgi:hypothetical protein